MNKFLVFAACVSLLVTQAGLAFDKDLPPTFIISGEQFNAKQLNDYKIGNFDKAIGQDQLLEALEQNELKPSNVYEIEYGKYYYFLYVVQNEGQTDQVGIIDWPVRLPETEIWQIRPGASGMKKVERFPAVSDAVKFEIPVGRSYLVGKRLAQLTITSPIQGVALKDFGSYAQERLWITHGIAGGIAIALSVIAATFAMFWFDRRAYYIYYALYCLASLGIFIEINGYTNFSILSFASSTACAAFFLVLFCNDCLAMKKDFPRVYKSSFVLLILVILLALASAVTHSSYAVQLSIPLAMGFCLLTALLRLREKNKKARLFVLGCGFFWVCSIATILNSIFAIHMALGYAAFFGFLFEISIFLLALMKGREPSPDNR